MAHKRTPQDEYEYDQNLRRETDIQREVIVELRAENRLLWENNRRILAALIDAQEALGLYREKSLQTAEFHVRNFESTHCVVGCTKHRWDDKDGWHRTNQTEPV